ncbi:MAG: hypothetical protein WCO52_04305 [bacterium]
MHYLIGIGAILAGVIIEIYCFRIVKIFGHLGWAERRLGPGGTYTAWRLIGIAAILAGYWVIANGIPGQS